MTAAVILIICGACGIMSSFLNNTKNVVSAIVYKVIPFTTGMITIGIALGMLDVINIPV